MLGTRVFACPLGQLAPSVICFTDADSEAVCPDFPQAAHIENAETELEGCVFFHFVSVPSGVARTRREETLPVNR